MDEAVIQDPERREAICRATRGEPMPTEKPPHNPNRLRDADTQGNRNDLRTGAAPSGPAADSGGMGAVNSSTFDRAKELLVGVGFLRVRAAALAGIGSSLVC
jgi:hypothetical protein